MAQITFNSMAEFRKACAELGAQSRADDDAVREKATKTRVVSRDLVGDVEELPPVKGKRTTELDRLLDRVRPATSELAQTTARLKTFDDKVEKRRQEQKRKAERRAANQAKRDAAKAKTSRKSGSMSIQTVKANDPELKALYKEERRSVTRTIREKYGADWHSGPNKDAAKAEKTRLLAELQETIIEMYKERQLG